MYAKEKIKVSRDSASHTIRIGNELGFQGFGVTDICQTHLYIIKQSSTILGLSMILVLDHLLHLLSSP